jgi:hypothetical protein
VTSTEKAGGNRYRTSSGPGHKEFTPNFFLVDQVRILGSSVRNREATYQENTWAKNNTKQINLCSKIATYRSARCFRH